MPPGDATIGYPCSVAAKSSIRLRGINAPVLQRFVDMDFMFSAPCSRPLGQHAAVRRPRHPRTMRRSWGRSPLRRRWALPAAALRHRLLHFIEKYRDRWPRSAGAGAGFSPPQSAGWWSLRHRPSQRSPAATRDGPARRLRDAEPSIRINACGFKLVAHDARPLPAQHVCAGLTLNVAPKVAGPAPRGSFDQDYPDGQ